jgi:alkylresorcinol/alkylpyrone synthase
VGTALPPHRVDQQDAKRFAAAWFSDDPNEGSRRLQVFDHSGVESRRVCMPLSWYERPHDFAESNALYVEHGLTLAASAARRALEGSGLLPSQVDHVVFVSSTGIATPSLDARLANLMGFREDVRRTPLWGLGCAGGAAGMSRAREFALAQPRSHVLLVTLELCTLTFQRSDLDLRNLVAASLFSDGAAAAVILGPDAPSPGDRPSAFSLGPGLGALELLASSSTLWRDTLDVMGWTVDAHGLHVVFSRDIPALVRRRVRPGLESFLVQLGLELDAIAHFVTHPGGPKVLEAFAEALALPIEAFRHAREVLRRCGNMSSPTCLFVLERMLEEGAFRPRDLGLVMALGPGFSSEVLLVRAR